jgi:hypothetical protein
MTDDHGDQFPGALPPAAPAHHPASDERLVRTQAEYVRKVNSLVEAGREDLAHELAESFAQESGGARRPAGRRTPTRGEDGRRPAAGPLGRFTRRSLRRLDRYTLDVFHPRAPYGRSQH